MSQQEPDPEPAESLPAWSLAAGAGEQISIGVEWPERVTREWGWGGSTGKGVSVCILDSGVEADHPLVGQVDRAVAFKRGEDERSSRRRHRRRPLRGTAPRAPGSSVRLRPSAPS
jgi:subtilisin family serine protease